MFRDPYVLEEGERVELIQQIRDAISLEPNVPELRVLLGMTLCVNFDAQTALEELREAVRLAPDNFLARLKFGELLMRLRICSQAAEETQTAATLAANPVQSELARRQAATIRTMLREGVERGNYGKLLSVFERIGRLFPRAQQDQTAVTISSR
jgi:cytochrome c-type biogenesis protein CcmH/NrfG